MRKNILIYVDGIDGCGKSTVAKYISSTLNMEYVNLIGYTGIGSIVRDRCLVNDSPPTDYVAVTMLASAIESYYDVILPLLKSGKSVIVDRSIASFYAYQAKQGNLAEDVFKSVMKTCDQYPQKRPPDLYLYCDVEPDIAMLRCLSRNHRDAIDNKDIAYKRLLRFRYQEFYNNIMHSWNCMKLNCSNPFNETKDEICGVVIPLLRQMQVGV